MLPRLYPRMLELAYEHQDAGRPIFICTAAAQEMAELLAIVLTFDGAVGSVAEVIDGVYTGREGGPFNYREGKAQAIRELAAREDIDLAASYAYSRQRVRPADAAARRASCGRQPGQGAGARGARGGVGDHAVRATRAQAARRRGGGAACGSGAAVGRAVRTMSLHELTDDQREIRDLTRRFADEKIAPHAAQWDREHHFPRELFAELGELGLMGVCVPEEHGGAGADFLAYVLVLEELSRADAGVGVTVAVHTSAGTLPILNHGCDEQIERARAAAGQRRGALRVRAHRVRLAAPTPARCAPASPTTGSPAPSSGSPTAPSPRTFIVFAKEDDKPSAFLVRAGAEGFAVTREEEKMGLNSSSTADLAFEDTPAERLGEPGNGMRVALRTLDGGRIGIAAQAVGIAQAALELATAYAKERNAFGGPIARFQAIQHKLADMQTEIEAARALVWRAARLKEAGRPHTRRGRPGQALRLRGRPPPDRRGDPDPRRLRLHQGVPGRALLPRRQGHRDLRGHERDPAARDRPRAARRSDAR